MSLPAGPMISLTVALEATYTLWPRGAAPREMPGIEFVTGNHANVLQPGELLRSIHLPVAALVEACRVSSCIPHQARPLRRTDHRNAAIRSVGDLLLTITAATPRPVQLRFAQPPSAAELRQAIDARIPADGYFDDVHGSAAYKRHLTYHFAEQIRAELARAGSAGMNDIAIAPWTEPRCRHARLQRQSSPLRRHARTGPVPAHLPARARLSRRQEGLRCRRLRRLHRLARRHARAFLPDARLPRRRARGDDHRGPRGERRAAPDAAGLPGCAGVPVRLLRRRHDHDRHGARVPISGPICRTRLRVISVAVRAIAPSPTRSTAWHRPRKTWPAKPAGRACAIRSLSRS